MMQGVAERSAVMKPCFCCYYVMMVMYLKVELVEVVEV